MEHGLVWPNAESAVNSDPWLIANHDRIRLMQPRVLVVNFVHGLAEPEARAKLDGLCAALRESSRWQGFRDPAAPPFLDYQHRRHRRPDRAARRGATATPPSFPRAADGVGFDYGALYEMRLHDGLRLDELTERGLVNEVWLLADHTAHSAPWETVEVKHSYDLAFRPLGFERHAGNSGEHNAPWIGRSLRILFVNFARGVGCAMESLGHSLERMATCGALPYYERYFREYAMLDLDRRYGLPFESLYLRAAPGRLPDADDPAVPRGLAPAHGRGLRRRRRQRPLHAQRAPRLRPRQPRAGPVDDRDLAPAGEQARARGRRTCSSPTATSPPTAWAAGSSTGARTCPGSATPRSTTTAAR